MNVFGSRKKDYSDYFKDLLNRQDILTLSQLWQAVRENARQLESELKQQQISEAVVLSPKTVALFLQSSDSRTGLLALPDIYLEENWQLNLTNARAFLKIQEEFGPFDAYSWQFVGGKCKVNKLKTMREIPITSKESDALSKELKKRGFNFVGSTIIYAHMQAVGMVNDHTTGCFRYKELLKLNRK